MPYLNLDDPMETLKTFIRQVNGKGISWQYLCNAAINYLLRYKIPVWTRQNPGIGFTCSSVRGWNCTRLRLDYKQFQHHLQIYSGRRTGITSTER